MSRREEVAEIQPCRRDFENICDVAVHHGQTLDLRCSQAHPLLGRQRIHQRRFPGYRHVIGNAADLKSVGPPDVLRRAKRNAAAFVGPESRERDLERIRAGRYGSGRLFKAIQQGWQMGQEVCANGSNGLGRFSHLRFLD